MPEGKLGNVVICPRCGNEIGHEYYLDEITLLDCGGVLIRRLEANCKQCGQDIFWIVPNMHLERLIKRARDRDNQKS